MRKKLLAFLALILLSGFVHAETYRCQDAHGYYSFSANPCATANAVENVSDQPQPDSGSRPELKTPNRETYTKDLAAMPSPDDATKACFNYVNTTARFPDPATTKLLSSSRKWVTVKHVGGRQMLTIGVTSKNEAGMYLGVQRFNCLLMGDHTTINKDGSSDFSMG